MPTIHDVAREAGVSARTVSRVLNEAVNVRAETRSLVLSVAERLAFRPDPSARALKSGRKRVIGLVANAVSSDATLRRIEILSKLFNASGYAAMVQFADTSAIEEAAIRELAPHCDGLIVFTNLSSPHSPSLDELDANSYPFILVDPPLAVSYPAIHVDRRSGYREAVKYLASKGRSQFLLVIEDFRKSERIAGFQEGLAQAGLNFDEINILRTSKGFAGGRQAASGVETAFHDGRVDAVLCHNDKIALGLMGELQAKGIRVPEDMAIIGFDDDAFSAFMRPALTTIAQGGGDVGAYIFEQLRNRIEYGTPIESRSYGTGLIQRDSA
ncbi:HTH-type transcriptional repressor PurR [Treponema sp.]